MEARRETLRALARTLVPADDHPDAWNAGFARYHDALLAGDLAAERVRLERGLDDLDREAEPAGFSELDDDERTGLLARLERGEAGGHWRHDPRRFVADYAAIAAESYYADPVGGANGPDAGWPMCGYDPAPKEAFSPPTTETGPDPVPDLASVDEEYDAIVVGAGAGGGVAACVLAEAGLRVLAIERGRWYRADEVSSDHLRNHRLARYGHNTGPEAEGHPRVLVDGDGREHHPAPHEGAYHNNAMAVGGGTRVYGAQAWRFLPDDFRMASRYGVPEGSSLADWPLAYEDLAPCYARAEREIGVCGRADPALHAAPREGGFPMPPLPDTAEARCLRTAAADLWIAAGPAPLLINSRPYGGRQPCVGCGACVGFACPSDGKNGSHNTVIPRALATGRCDLITETQVLRVRVDDRGRAEGVDAVAVIDGVECRRSLRAVRVVLAGGAIETARLLLASATPRFPDGLGNAGDQVGRHLQGHTYSGVQGLLPQPLIGDRGPGVAVATTAWNHGNDAVIGGAMLANEFVLLPILAWHRHLPPDLPRWGPENKRFMRENFHRLVQIKGPVQEIPDPGARVRLDPGIRDRFGMPVARLEGGRHPETLRTAAVIAERARDWVAATGSEWIWDKAPAGRELSAGQHQIGTCRMGHDPATSVCDASGRVHAHPGLQVADGSLLVTGGGFNPVLTIFALAYRVAEAIVAEAR